MKHPLSLRRLAPSSLIAVVALAGACSSDPDTEAGKGDAESGSALYAELCASCHGAAAEGAFGPRLAPWTRGASELVSIIDATMPQGEPEECDRQCAEDIAAFITGLSVDCDGPRALPQRLRLLTRREYRNTVTDLFHASMGSSCAADADCQVASESCTGGVCTADPCTLHTFVYDAKSTSPSTVHVAGSFNGWPATIAAGGYPMQKIPGSNTWYVKHEIAPGSHEYKLVIDESEWLSDPANPVKVGDYGNSALTVACGAPPGGGATGLDPAADFPAESRPTGFPFDDHEGALATAVHVDQYWKAASLLADSATQDMANLLPCDLAIDPDACARDFIVDFGGRAFRRPLEEAEIAKYQSLFDQAPDAVTGVSIVVRTMLSSPLFLYRSEIGAPLGDGTFRLTPHETATALSYTFWGTMPDAELFGAAGSGALASPAEIEKQARRLLADPRSRPVFETFAVQWLGVEELPARGKTASLYPEWSPALAASMVEETRRFFTHVVFEGSHRYDDLLLADFTFADPALAAHYGLAPTAGGFEQVSSPEHRKAGLLGHGSVLAVNAYADQSSPIRRGLFVRRSLLCQDLPAPPANAATLPEIDPDATTRERFAQHTADPACHDCHRYIDDLGFGFEKFDATGKYREMENGQPIDASGDMNDVEALGSKTHAPFASLHELAQTLAQSKSAEACFARQTYRFAMGRLESEADVCGISELGAAFDESGGDIQELWIELTKLDEFTRRK